MTSSFLHTDWFSERLSGKVAIITGAGGGIGAETARVLAAQGAKVVCADIQQDRAGEVADAIRTNGGNAISFAVDISSEASVASMVAKSIDAFGKIDILHNNAALISMEHMARDGAILDIDVAHWDRTMAVNLRGPMLCTKHVLPQMIQNGGGSIINMGSGKAVQGDLAQTAYGTSKAGLLGFTRYAAAQYGKDGVRVNMLIVGVIIRGNDLIGKDLSPQRVAQLKRYGEHNLTNYLGSPRHVADTVAFLSSEESAYITGAEIAVDGGFTSHTPSLADGRQVIFNKAPKE